MLFFINIKFQQFKILIIPLLFTFLPILSFSQINDELITNSFEAYTNLPREVAYAHLNKSIYIKGETMAFSVYVFDKNDKHLSNLTTNLYCTISDEKGKTIKSKLLFVDNGVTNGSFFVDSLFASGNYTFKAYTNYMKNFDEQNFYIQSIKIVDPEIESNIIPKIISSTLDAQFLPEGGHLLADVSNTMGVAIKDSLGFGIPFVEGKVLNSKNEVLNTFKTNQFGIGKFIFTPIEGDFYKATIDFEGTQQIFTINSAEKNGVILFLNDLNNKVALRISTNKNTINTIKNKPYKLTIHNGKEFKIINVQFDDNLEIIKLINYKDLFSGINIFTLFNEKNKPLLERLFFKYDGIKLLETSTISYKKEQDSIIVTLPIKEIDKNSVNKFSISILPTDTKSYKPQQNIISSVFLQPYVKGYIENAKYYFTEITRTKKYELDNLLLSQGWSSYDWHTIFTNIPKIIYPFENGINFTANVNQTKSGDFIMYPTSFNGLETFQINEKKTFEKIGLFPFDNEKIRISEIRKNDELKKSGLYLQFYPSEIPEIEKYFKPFLLKEDVFFNSNLSQPLLETSWTEYEQLDEILINSKNKEDRFNNIQNAHGELDVFDDTKRRSYFDFATYIRTKGFDVSESGSEFKIYSKRSFTLNGNLVPTIYINNRLVSDFSELTYYYMDMVDYIIINKSGYGNGARGAGGVIKIFTDPRIGIKNNPNISNFQEINIPLTFSTPTKFYTPKYSFYQSRFFKEYGVIEWFPDKSVNENGAISFKISNQSGNNIKLFIEGTANNGSFISEVKSVTFN